MHKVCDRQRAIVVLGMHRSGTSALTGVLHLLGVALGSRLLPAREGVNDRGFWEHADIVAVHDRLLAVLDSSWDDVCPLPPAWWQQPDVVPFRDELLHIVRRDFAGTALWGLKDPRLCRLLPLWLEIFATIGCHASFVIIAREPQEVVRSLARRDGLTQQQSSALWLSHMLEAVQWTQTHPRVLVTYEALLNDWCTTVAHIATGLSCVWPREPSTAARAITKFLAPELRHQRYAADQWELESALAVWLDRVYQVFATALQIPAAELDEQLAPVRHQMTISTQLFGVLLKQQHAALRSVGAGFSQASQALAERDTQLAQAQAELAEVGTGFTQACQWLTERDTQLAQAQAELAEVGAGLTQACQFLTERDTQLAQVQAELATVHAELAAIRAHWGWRIIQQFSGERKAMT